MSNVNTASPVEDSALQTFDITWLVGTSGGRLYGPTEQVRSYHLTDAMAVACKKLGKRECPDYTRGFAVSLGVPA